MNLVFDGSDYHKGGWIYLPHNTCRALKAPSAKGNITFISVWQNGRLHFGRPLPHPDPATNSTHIHVKYSREHVDDVKRITVYGKLPMLETVVVKCQKSRLTQERVRIHLINCIATDGMEIKINDELVFSVVSVQPLVPLGLINANSQVILEEAVVSEKKLAEEGITAIKMIQNPQSSLDHAFNRLYEMICFPIIYKEQVKDLPLPQGILISGPPGVGKTHLVRRIAESVNVPLIAIDGSEIFSPVQGESEENMRNLFGEAYRAASTNKYHMAIIFIDEIDTVASKRSEDSGSTSVRLTTQLLTLIDGAGRQRLNQNRIILIGATNRPNDVDSAMRRPGRFDREIIIEPPTVSERKTLLESMIRVEGIDCAAIAKCTIGYVAADLSALYREACLASIKSRSQLTMEHFLTAMKSVGPSLTREYRISVDPYVSLDSIGGYESVKEKIDQVILGPLRNPEPYVKLGIKPPRGILMYGPPGCSKTTFAKALANTGGFNFYSINGASAFSAFVGESERIIRETFLNARMTAPSIIFVDEIDAMVGGRALGAEGDQVQERILSTFLNEMDGMATAKTVIVLGATNRLDSIDSALLRPGRFDYLLEIPLPDCSERLAILQVHAKKISISSDDDADLKHWAALTEGWSGAELKNLLQESALIALRLDMEIVDYTCIEQAYLICAKRK